MPVEFDVPRSPKIGTEQYNDFKGVDFANSGINVNPQRSPDSINMVSDQAGFPTKRTGYTLIHKFEDRINGMFRLKTSAIEKRILHAGTKMYNWAPDDEFTEIYDGLGDNRSVGFQMGGNLYILDGTQFLTYYLDTDSSEYVIKPVSEKAYAPTTSIARAPTGGGVTYEAVNLMSAKRKNTFLGTASVKPYQLDGTNLDAAAVTARILQANGTWVDRVEGTDFTVNRTTGVVTFNTAPGVSPVTGRDNVEITYSKSAEGYFDKINHCDVFTVYGIGGVADRIFVSGNPKFPNYDWYSQSNDPTYFPDLSYSVVGQESSAIMGYRKVGGSLAIFKEDNQQDPTVFLRSGQLRDDGSTLFTISQGIAGIGTISKYCFANLVDDPLFLSKDGVYSIATKDITLERYAQQRSFFIANKLNKEPGLDEAVAISFDGRYILSVNGVCYVADNRQEVTRPNSTSLYSDFQYEWYYWTNINARTFFKHDDRLYFGTPDGELMMFWNEKLDIDILRSQKYADVDKPVEAYWRFPLFYGGTFAHYKTIRGVWAVSLPYLRSSIEIFYAVKSVDTKVKTRTLDIFDFNDIEFDRLTFSTDTWDQIIPTNRKRRKFKIFQLMFVNKQAEPFGFSAAEIQYVVLNSRIKG